MNSSITFHAVTQGESHKDKGMSCQDAAISYADTDNGIYIVAVSDGHGSESHFMSEHGSEIAVNVAIKQIRDFLKIQESHQLSVPYANSGKISRQNDVPEKEDKHKKKQNDQDRILKELISSVISNWNITIEKHWKENKPAKKYMNERNVPTEAVDDYLNGVQIENAYGCTLIAYAVTTDYWFAFQIGDGSCIAFDDKATPFCPIPDDERYTGSKTASMCNDDAIESFRYCYGSDRKPVAAFVASDGMDGAYGQIRDFSIPQLNKFYGRIIRSFNSKSYEETVEEISTVLPQLSAKGVTRDDISLAAIINPEEIKQVHSDFLRVELEDIEEVLITKEKQIQLLKQELKDKQFYFEQNKANIKKMDNEVVRYESELKNIVAEIANAEKDRGTTVKRKQELEAELIAYENKC